MLNQFNAKTHGHEGRARGEKIGAPGAFAAQQSLAAAAAARAAGFCAGGILPFCADGHSESVAAENAVRQMEKRNLIESELKIARRINRSVRQLAPKTCSSPRRM